MKRRLLGLALVVGLLAPAAAASGQQPPRDDSGTEIVRGQPAGTDEYPFQVGLLHRGVANRFQAQFCGGTLISPDTVLTAAHCLAGFRPRQVDVLVGTNRLGAGAGTRVPARRLRIHPGFDARRYRNDVGIVQLGGQRPEGLVRTVQPGEDALWAPGTTATAIGWGALSENGSFPHLLHEVEVPIRGNPQCADQYRGIAAYYGALMLCAGGLVPGGGDACQGDSGGPLLVEEAPEQWVQVGITSWGIGCGRPRFPGVYTRLAAYASFVNPYLDPDSVPRPVTGIRARRLSATSFRMTWRPPAFDGGTRITRYRVRIPALGRDHGVLGNQRRLRLWNLPRGPHRVEIVAVNAVGTSVARAAIIRV